MPNFPFNFGGVEIGGFRSLVTAARQGILWPWDMASTHQWEARILARDLRGAASTQVTAITIPSSGFVSGRLTVTFSGGLLGAPVNVTADATVAQDENDLGDALETAITTAIGTTLAGTVASVENTGASNAVNVTMVAGVGPVTVTAVFAPAQVLEVQFGGTLLNGAYRSTISGGGLGSPVAVTTTRAAGTPANVAAMAVQHEADIEALVATTLAGVVVSANDDATDTNVVQFAPGIATASITTAVPPGTTLTFGGTAMDGSYATTITHSSIPAGSATVTTARAAGSPATNSDLAAQHETDIEADPRISALIASADDTGATNAVLGFAGITGLTFSTSAPAPGTLTSAPPTMTVTDATPAGPTVTVTHSVHLNLGSLCPQGAFPAHVMRCEVALEVDTAFGVGRTITVGDADDRDALLGGTPVTLNSTGRSLAASGVAQYRTRYEAGLVPTATIDLGSSLTVTTGKAYVQINFTPHPSHTASAA
jgi:hypothetical protein